MAAIATWFEYEHAELMYYMLTSILIPLLG